MIKNLDIFGEENISFQIMSIEDKINEIIKVVNKQNINISLIDDSDIKTISNALIHYGYYEEEDRFLLLQKLQNGVETAKEEPKDGLWYQGKILPLEYEECVDLLAHFRDSGVEKNKVLTREKCSKAFGTIIPMTSY